MDIREEAENARVEMNMTPMIDVVFLLIIFFMLITQMVVTEVEELELPTAEMKEDPKTKDKQRIIVNIIRGGKDMEQGVVVIHGREYRDSKILEAFFMAVAEGRMFDAEGKKFSKQEVLIRPDRNIKYRIIEVVIRALIKARIFKIQFGVKPEK